MARQGEGCRLRGTIDGITFYCLDGVYYARSKSSLSGKKVKTSPRFARTRYYAALLGKASSLAAPVYRSLPKERQVYALYCALRSAAYAKLKQGLQEGAVRNELIAMTKPKQKGRRVAAIRVVTPARLMKRKEGLFVVKMIPPCYRKARTATTLTSAPDVFYDNT